MTDAADDFDALFEQESAKRAAAVASPQAAELADDDLEGLFDQIAASRAAPAAAAAQEGGWEVPEPAAPKAGWEVPARPAASGGWETPAASAPPKRAAKAGWEVPEAPAADKPAAKAGWEVPEAAAADKPAAKAGWEVPEAAAASTPAAKAGWEVPQAAAADKPAAKAGWEVPVKPSPKAGWETPEAPAPSPAVAADPAPDGEAGDASDAGDKPMYERLGDIVRLMHDSLGELGYDKTLTQASTQMTAVQDRLEYVASLTEKAATTVLNTLDKGLPAQNALAQAARSMDARWGALFAGQLSVDEFKQLATDSRQFARTVSETSDEEKARLLEIMMAQDFQDITGQLITKVVALTKTVEHELAELLRDNAPAEARERLLPKQLMQGPSVPSIALDQDKVDNLLGNLGF
jgi:chemotaxis protein CheZ